MTMSSFLPHALLFHRKHFKILMLNQHALPLQMLKC